MTTAVPTATATSTLLIPSFIGTITSRFTTGASSPGADHEFRAIPINSDQDGKPFASRAAGGGIARATVASNQQAGDTLHMTSTTMAASPQLALHPRPTARQRLTSQVKSLALAHCLSVSAVTSAEAFPEVFTILRDRIEAGHLAGLDWFTTERAAASCDPKTLMADSLSILSVGVAYWGSDDGKPDDGVPRGRISRYARGRDYREILSVRMRALHASIE